MSPEAYYTRIKPVKISPWDDGDGVHRYKMTTQIDDSKIGTEESFRNNLIREGYILQPLKWLPRLIYTGAAVYLLAAPSDHLMPASMTFSITILARSIWENRLAKWESEKSAFNSSFSDNQIQLIPEKYHPGNLLKKVNPLQLLRKRKI